MMMTNAVPINERSREGKGDFLDAFAATEDTRNGFVFWIIMLAACQLQGVGPVLQQEV